MANSLRARDDSAAPPEGQPAASLEEGARPEQSLVAEDPRSLFRRQALEAHAAGQELPGSPLRISPRWVAYVFPLLMAALLSLGLVAAWGSVGDFGQGRAVVVLPQGGESGSSGARVVALFPGHLRPLLKEGMPLRFEVDGFRDSVKTVPVAQLEEGVLSVAQVEERLGVDFADSEVPVEGIAVVYGELPAEGFEATGESLTWHHGLRGRVHISLGERRLLPTLLPGLQPLFGDDER
ncbi:MAG: hypothetical protein AAGD01_05210 [Acidobacteriota bacterium]